MPPQLDLRGADLEGCGFGEVDFSGAERRAAGDARYTAAEWRRHADSDGEIHIPGRYTKWAGAPVVAAAHGGGLLLSGSCARGADFGAAVLPSGIDLRDVGVAGCSFRGADFSNGMVLDMDMLRLVKREAFEGARIKGSGQLDLRRCVLDGWDASHIDFTDGLLLAQASVKAGNFRSAVVPPQLDLRGADLEGCGFGEVNFSGAERRAAGDARYTAAEWRRHADSDGEIHIPGGGWTEWAGAPVVAAAHGGGLLLSGSCARGADFGAAVLPAGIDLRDVGVAGCSFRGADFSKKYG
eukprot:gene10533-2697_t